MTIGAWFLPNYNRFYFILKHTLTYALITIIGIRVILRIYRKYQSHPNVEASIKNIRILQGFTLVVIVGLFVITRAGQNYVIDKFQTPPVEVCYYYDQYGNFIHASRIRYQCPEPMLTTNHQNEDFILDFEYDYLGERPGGYSSGSEFPNQSLYYRVDDGYSRIRIEIKYQSEGIINYRRIREVTNYLSSEYQKDESIEDFENQFTLVHETIMTNYFEAIITTTFEEGYITQSKDVYRIRSQFNHNDKVNVASFYDFSNHDVTYDTVYRLYYDETEDGLEYEVYVDIPVHDKVGETPSYLGYVKNTSGFKTIDYRWREDHINPDIEAFHGVGDVYIFKNDSIHHSNRHFEFLNNNEYTKLNDKDIFILTQNEQNNPYSNYDYDYETELTYYNEKVLFKGKYGFDYVYEKTFYGYVIKKYGNDGVVGTNGLYNDSSEVISSNNGLDDMIISYDNPQHFIYNYQPVFDVNEMLKYLINQVE